MEKYLGVKLINAELCLGSGENSGKEGYIVVYENNYTSWSPKNVFEEAYRRINSLTFGLAIEALKKGKKVARAGWNGKGMFLELQIPDEYSKMSLPYIYMKTVDNKLVPWLASQTDVLTEDWNIVE